MEDRIKNPEWYPIPENQTLVLDYFLWYSRIEYALKSNKDFSRGGECLKANWENLKKKLEGEKMSSLLLESLSYIKKYPPCTEVEIDKWEPISTKESSDWGLLIDSAKVVRNNLFHGGKHGNRILLAPARDEKLLKHCLAILQNIVPLFPDDLQETFYGLDE